MVVVVKVVVMVVVVVVVLVVVVGQIMAWLIYSLNGKSRAGAKEHEVGAEQGQRNVRCPRLWPLS